MTIRFRSYPLQIKMVLGFLVLELLIPVIWLLTGALLPTIPFVSASSLGLLLSLAILPLSSIIGIIIGKRWGRNIAIFSLAFWLTLAGIFLLLEVVRFFVTDYPDPILFTAGELAVLSGMIIISKFGITWLKSDYGNNISSELDHSNP